MSKNVLVQGNWLNSLLVLAFGVCFLAVAPSVEALSVLGYL